MPKLTADEIVDKQIRNASNNVEDVVKGIERMKETPGVSAKKKKEKYRLGVLRALENGDWEAGHDSYSLQEFKDRAIPKIRERYASGMAASRAKSLEARIQLNAFQQAIQSHIETMPDATESQREMRMTYNLREMRKFKLKRVRR